MAKTVRKGLIAEEDFSKWDGSATETFNRSNSDGSTTARTKIGAITNWILKRLTLLTNPTISAPALLIRKSEQHAGGYDVVLRPKAEDGATAILFGRSPVGGTNPTQAIATIEAHGSYTDDDALSFTDKNLIFYTSKSTGGLESIARFEALQTTPRVIFGRGAGNEIAGSLKLESKDGLNLAHRLTSSIVASTGASRSSNVVTLTTTAAHGMATGDTIRVAGVTDSSFDGVFTIASTPTSTTLTYAQTAANATSGGGTVYDGYAQAIVIPSYGGYKIRNEADNADLSILSKDSANNIYIGHSAADSYVNSPNVNLYRVKASRGTALASGDFALSAGWGTTASVGSISGTDQFCQFTITSAGTGQGASPTCILTFKDGTWTTAPIVQVNRQEFANQATVTFTVTTVTATAVTLTFNGTPVAAETYKVTLHVGGI